MNPTANQGSSRGDLDRAGLLAAALGYAKLGWPVFPCRPDAKEPATKRGFQDATCDPDRIEAWWRRRPTLNVGIATGDPGPDVLDVDTAHDKPGLRTLERLRQAGLIPGPQRLVATPSGGLHLYFTGSSEGNHAKARHGIDTRAAGGYVLAPPSTYQGRPYRLLEARPAEGALDWPAIARLLDPPSPTGRQRPVAAPESSRDGLAGLVRFVEQLGDGNRNNGLFWAACRAVEAGHQDLDPLLTAACRAGLAEPEARRTIASAQRRAPRASGVPPRG